MTGRTLLRWLLPILGVVVLAVAISGAIAKPNTPETSKQEQKRVNVPITVTQSVADAGKLRLTWAGGQAPFVVATQFGDGKATTHTAEKASLTTDITMPKKSAEPGLVQYSVTDAQGESVTGTLTVVPAAPRHLTVKEVSAEAATIVWKAGENAAAYDIAVSTKKAKPGKVLRPQRPSKTFTAKLKPDTTYWVRVRSVNTAGASPFSKPIKLRTLPETIDVKVAAWNICAEACSGYSGRAGKLAAHAHSIKPDVLALQEAGGVRVGPKTHGVFASNGLVLANGGAKSRYLYYRASRFEQEAGGLFALGDGHYAAWAKLSEKRTGAQFIVSSVHLITGRGGGPDGKRGQQASSLVSQLRGINPDGLPVILAGDFNSGRHRTPHSPGRVLAGAGFADSVEIAARTQDAHINTGHSKGRTVVKSSDHVDHIYVSTGTEVGLWQQHARISGSRYSDPYLTDHNLIAANVEVKPESAKMSKLTPLAAEQPADLEKQKATR